MLKVLAGLGPMVILGGIYMWFEPRLKESVIPFVLIPMLFLWLFFFVIFAMMIDANFGLNAD
jgi:hypothetical protein